MGRASRRGLCVRVIVRFASGRPFCVRVFGIEPTRHQGMICDRCGVKVTSSSSRRERLAHVELGMYVRHPFATSDETLDAFPVLPAAFVEAPRGGELAGAYERLIGAASAGIGDISAIIAEACDLLMPTLVSAHDWNLRDAETIARGLGLVRVEQAPVDGWSE